MSSEMNLNFLYSTPMTHLFVHLFHLAYNRSWIVLSLPLFLSLFSCITAAFNWTYTVGWLSQNECAMQAYGEFLKKLFKRINSTHVLVFFLSWCTQKLNLQLLLLFIIMTSLLLWNSKFKYRLRLNEYFL